MKSLSPALVFLSKVLKSWSRSTGEVVESDEIVEPSGISGSEFAPGEIET